MHAARRVVFVAVLAVVISTVQGRGRVSARALDLDLDDVPLEGSVALAEPPSAWDTFVADVTVRRHRVNAAGAPAGGGPETATFRWQRSRQATGWKTTFTLVARDGLEVRTDQGTTQVHRSGPSVATVQFDASGGSARFFDRSGRELQLASADDVQRALGMALEDRPTYQRLRRMQRPVRASAKDGAEWIGSVILAASGREQRAAALVREFGRAAGRYEGRDCFVRTDGEVMREVLVDPSSAIPVEMNVVRGGALVTHTTFSYAAGTEGSFVRRAVHVEAALPGAEQERRVTDISFTNVRFEQRGGR